MDFTDIERILELVREHDLAEFELEHEGLKLRVRKASATPVFQAAPMAGMPAVHLPLAPPLPPAAAAVPAPAAGAEPPDDEINLAVVKSPIVGTFYRSPEPGAASFVDVGQRVKKDQVLCIIEAMKLMNEIECDMAGEIVKRFVQSGQPVEYGQSLFAVRPR